MVKLRLQIKVLNSNLVETREWSSQRGHLRNNNRILDSTHPARKKTMHDIPKFVLFFLTQNAFIFTKSPYVLKWQYTL